jgi:hypothetical protein
MSLIFMFGEMDRAKAFVAEVKKRFGLDGQVFDDAEEAHRHDPFPWVQEPPVAHIDRCDPETEVVIERLAPGFGGTFIGT